MAGADNGLPIKEDARLKIRPRIFLEGNWFVDVTPGSPSAPVLDGGRRDPRRSRPRRPCSSARCSPRCSPTPARTCRSCSTSTAAALEPDGAKGYARSIKYWEGAFRDSAIVNEATLGSRSTTCRTGCGAPTLRARPGPRPGRAAGAADQPRRPRRRRSPPRRPTSSAAIHELPRTLDRRAARRSARSTSPSRRCAASSPTCARPCASPARRSTPSCRCLRELRGLVSEPGGARPGPRPAPTSCPTWPSSTTEGVALQKQLRLLSSCTNEVLTPWRTSTIEDEQFPASGPVFQEQVKWLPGIAAESRNFDANGQYVRSLANGFNYAYDVGGGTPVPHRAAAAGRQPAQGATRSRRCAATCPARRRRRPNLRLRSRPTRPPQHARQPQHATRSARCGTRASTTRCEFVARRASKASASDLEVVAP